MDFRGLDGPISSPSELKGLSSLAVGTQPPKVTILVAWSASVAWRAQSHHTRTRTLPHEMPQLGMLMRTTFLAIYSAQVVNERIEPMFVTTPRTLIFPSAVISPAHKHHTVVLQATSYSGSKVRHASSAAFEKLVASLVRSQTQIMAEACALAGRHWPILRDLSIRGSWATQFMSGFAAVRAATVTLCRFGENIWVILRKRTFL